MILPLTLALPSKEFPNLTAENHRITSAETPLYNCIAWSTGNDTRWWQPNLFWPLAVDQDEFGIQILIEMFRSQGYEVCDNDSLEVGIEKVALYGSSFMYTHAARQLPSGRWTSKLGRSYDIEHDTPEALEGHVYGAFVETMARVIKTY